MARLSDTTSGAWKIVRPSVNLYSCAPFFVMAIWSVMFISLSVRSVADGQYAPGVTVVCGSLGLACVIAPFRIVVAYYVAISDTRVAVGRKRSRPVAVADRSRIAYVTATYRAAGLVNYRLCAADGTTLLVVHKQMDAAKIARMLGVDFYSAPGTVLPVRSSH